MITRPHHANMRPPPIPPPLPEPHDVYTRAPCVGSSFVPVVSTPRQCPGSRNEHPRAPNCTPGGPVLYLLLYLLCLLQTLPGEQKRAPPNPRQYTRGAGSRAIGFPRYLARTKQRFPTKANGSSSLCQNTKLGTAHGAQSTCVLYFSFSRRPECQC